MRRAMNAVLREAYSKDCERAVKRWNKILATEDCSQAMSSSRRSVFTAAWVRSRGALRPRRQPAREDDEWEARKDDFLPTQADRDYVKSTHVPVTEPGKFANWIAPPGAWHPRQAHRVRVRPHLGEGMEIKHTAVADRTGSGVDAAGRRHDDPDQPRYRDRALRSVPCQCPRRRRCSRAAQGRRSPPKTWQTHGRCRAGAAMWKLADLVERDAAEIAWLETVNQGKPIFESAKVEGPVRSVSLLRYYAGWADKLQGETIPVHPTFLNYTLKHPVGVVGMIVPWNFPLLLTAWKLAPALAAGCTAVIKPAELTPLTALKLGALCLEAGIPPGVVNVVPGKGSVAGPGHNRVARRRQDRVYRFDGGGSSRHEDLGRHCQTRIARAGR